MGFGLGAIVGAAIGGIVGYASYTPTQITGFTKHRLNQVISRNGHGVANKAILETMKNPTQIIKQTGKGFFRTTYKFVGKNAQIVLNKAGKVVTAIAKHKIGRRIGAWIVSIGLGFLVGNENFW